jgi:hypothetical protein
MNSTKFAIHIVLLYVNLAMLGMTPIKTTLSYRGLIKKEDVSERNINQTMVCQNEPIELNLFINARFNRK